MTPQQIEDAARRKYNSVGSSFYAQAEIWDLIYQAECEIAAETRMLEGRTVISGGTVAGTQAYAYPTGVLELKRVEVDGQRLDKIDLKDDDDITIFNSNTTEQGTPQYYWSWNQSIYLRPIPDTSALQIRLFYYAEPALVITASQVLEVPAIHHMRIVDKVVGEMIAKDSKSDSNYYLSKWDEIHMPAMIKWVRKRKTGDGFSVVKDEETTSRTVLIRV